jgi:transposase-like protein
MSSKKVKEYSAEFKFKVVLELLKQENTQIEISQKYGIPTCTLRAWYNQFFESGDSVFTGKKQDKIFKDEIKAKEKEIEELHKTVGELTVANNWMKKKSRQAGLSIPKEYDR